MSKNQRFSFRSANACRRRRKPETSKKLGAEQLEPRVLLVGDLIGDFNDDGIRDVNDIDLLSADAAAGLNTLDFDLTSDGKVDLAC